MGGKSVAWGMVSLAWCESANRRKRGAQGRGGRFIDTKKFGGDKEKMKKIAAILMALIISGLLLFAMGNATAQSANPDIKINVIMFDPMGDDVGNEWIELYNSGTETQNINGWTISNRDGTADATLPDWDFPSVAYLVVHFGTGTNDNDFSDGNGHFYTGDVVEVFNNTEDECALYSGTPDALAIVDFVSWCSDGSYSGGTAQDYAVSAGIWDFGDYLDSFRYWTLCPVSDIGRDIYSTDTNQPEDWFKNGGINADGPTPSKDNDAFNIYDQSIRGTVEDTNGVPISGARISIDGTSIVAYSDNKGTYDITNAPVGVQTLKIYKEGYILGSRVIEVYYDEVSFFNPVLTPFGESKSVGPEGGTLNFSDGTNITIPAGALDTTVNLTVTYLAPDVIPITTQEEDISYPKLYGLDLSPHINFNTPVTITFPLGYLGDEVLDELSAGDTLQVRLFDPDTLTYSDYVNATVNSDSRSATMRVSHFTTTYTGWWTKYKTVWNKPVPAWGPDWMPLTNCQCTSEGVDTCTVQIDTERGVIAHASVGNSEIATLGVSISYILKQKFPKSFKSERCYDTRLDYAWYYLKWTGKRYVKIDGTWVFVENVWVAKPTGIKFNRVILLPFRPECDQCIPEFTTIAIPVVAILGLVFLFSRRKRKP